MAKRKLTPKLKKYLYDNRWKVRQEDYAGEALVYLHRLRSATKAANKRKRNTAKVGEVTIPRDSELYRIIEASAKIKKMPVSSFMRKYSDEIADLMQGDRIPITRETSYAISDINKLPKRSKIYINGEQVSKGDAIYRIQNLTSSAMQLTDTVVVNYEMSYSLTGDLYIELPTEEEIEEAEEADDDGELMDSLLSDSGGIVPVRSPGGKSKGK